MYIHHLFQHVNLNDLNLRLCDYELDMDAFASFRTRQLQASRVLFTDLTCLHREGVVSETNGIENTRVPSFLEDLHVVRALYYLIVFLAEGDTEFFFV